MQVRSVWKADLRPRFITRRISGHIGNGCFECTADFRLCESFVPKFGREVIDCLTEQELVWPGIAVMQSRNVLAKLPDDILEANLPCVVYIALFGHSGSMMLVLDVGNGWWAQLIAATHSADVSAGVR